LSFSERSPFTATLQQGKFAPRLLKAREAALALEDAEFAEFED
jgi:hypothetical protein